MQSTTSRHIFLARLLILFSQLRVLHVLSFMLSDKILYAFLVSPALTTCTETTVFWLSKQPRFISAYIQSFSTSRTMATGTCRAGLLCCAVIRVIARLHSRYCAGKRNTLCGSHVCLCQCLNRSADNF
jgi:hypothetical protein